MSNLTLFRELQSVRVELIQERQAKNYLKRQCELLRHKIEEQDAQLANSFQAFKLADAKRAQAEMENARLREQIAALEQREREHLEDEHKRTGQIAS